MIKSVCVVNRFCGTPKLAISGQGFKCQALSVFLFVVVGKMKTHD